MTMQIIQRTNLNATAYKKNRDMRFIVIHYTAGTTSRKGTAQNTASYFSKAKASADFIVDDAEIVQYNPDIDNRYCYAVGGSMYNGWGGSFYGTATNVNCISIEICSCNKAGKITTPNDDNYYFTRKAVKKAIKLTKHLMKKYDIPLIHVIRHYDVNSKPCPGVKGWNGDNEKEWLAFKEALR